MSIYQVKHIISRLTVSAIIYLYAVANKQSFNNAYFHLKYHYEKNMREIWRIQTQMKKSNRFLKWRQLVHAKITSTMKSLKLNNDNG